MTIDTGVRRAIFAVALVGTLIAATLPGTYAPTLGASDKINHMAAFVVLSALAAWAWPRAKLPAIAIAMSAFGALIELIQALPFIGRDAEVADWVADTAALAVTLAVVAIVRRLGDRGLQ